MRVDIEGGKYTYIFEDGRARLLRYGEPSRRDVVGDKLIYCMAAEISELRQQLTAATDQIAAAVAACKIKDDALEQALDDMGEDGHCVCLAAKVLMHDALAVTPSISRGETPQQLASAHERIEGVKEQRDTERAAYLNEEPKELKP